MNLTADLAIGAMFALALVQTVLDHRFRMKVADRLRVVNPAKAQQQADSAAQASAPIPLENRRPA